MKKTLLLSLLIAACGTADKQRAKVDKEPVAVATASLVEHSVWHSVWQGKNASASFGDEFEDGYLDVWQSRQGQEAGASLWYTIYRQDPTSEVCVDECICFPEPPPGVDGGGAAGAPPTPPGTDTGGVGAAPGGGPAPGGVGGGEPPPEADAGTCPPECFPYSYCYYSRYSYEDGYGDIPAADFKANPKVALLDTTVTTGENFFVYRCEFDDEAPDGGGCEDVEGTISIAARFVGNGQESYFNSGVYKETYGDTTYQSHGTFRGVSASADGNIGDLSFSSDNASIGSSHESQVERQVIREP